MENYFYLMRKNDVVALVNFDENGNMRHFSKDVNEEIAPIQAKYKPEWLKEWWRDRSIPLSRERIRMFLENQGFLFPAEYLVKNLGLSLTDYYWIKPVDSNLTWEKVNLFDNDFKEDIFILNKISENTDEIPHYSPNGSLQGDIEKTWAILNGKRCIVKGNRSYLSSESINEVFACVIHRLQGYDNYTDYQLIQIRDRDYLFGCYSEAFTSQKEELIPAYALYSSKKKPNGVSYYRHFMNICRDYGMDMEQLQQDMDYLILTDFIISEYDRHLNNFGVLRDADSLQMKRMAPIFDSGGCLFVNREIPRNPKQLLNLKSNGFTEKEVNMLRYVEDRNRIDLTKLPPASALREMYGQDNKMDEREINEIAYLYEKKIDLCRQFQLGKTLRVN